MVVWDGVIYMHFFGYLNNTYNVFLYGKNRKFLIFYEDKKYVKYF